MCACLVWKKSIQDGAVIYNNQVWLRNGHETAVCSIDDIQLRGRHNLLNVLAAVTLADSVGIPIDAMAEAIRTFNGVEHRLELGADPQRRAVDQRLHRHSARTRAGSGSCI